MKDDVKEEKEDVKKEKKEDKEEKEDEKKKIKMISKKLRKKSLLKRNLKRSRRTPMSQRISLTKKKNLKLILVNESAKLSFLKLRRLMVNF